MILFYYPYPNLNKLIILPNPELGNRQLVVGRPVVKQTIDGELFTYIKRPKAEEYIFDLQFSTVSRDKFDQTATWVRDYDGYIMRFHDWHGDIYKVQLLSDRIDFIMDKLTMPCIPGRTESGSFRLSLRGVPNG